MRRREFIAGLGGAAVWPLTVHGQPAVPVIGVLNTPIGRGLEATDGWVSPRA
jgi:phosphoribosylcarboxyaminoimidazole (NCAIR) mutase